MDELIDITAHDRLVVSLHYYHPHYHHHHYHDHHHHHHHHIRSAGRHAVLQPNQDILGLR